MIAEQHAKVDQLVGAEDGPTNMEPTATKVETDGQNS